MHHLFNAMHHTNAIEATNLNKKNETHKQHYN